jgi:hypothetical protein
MNPHKREDWGLIVGGMPVGNPRDPHKSIRLVQPEPAGFDSINEFVVRSGMWADWTDTNAEIYRTGKMHKMLKGPDGKYPDGPPRVRELPTRRLDPLIGRLQEGACSACGEWVRDCECERCPHEIRSGECEKCANIGLARCAKCDAVVFRLHRVAGQDVCGECAGTCDKCGVECDGKYTSDGHDSLCKSCASPTLVATVFYDEVSK